MEEYESAVDESYLIALHDHDEPLIPISDEAYAEELQIQEILISSSPLIPSSALSSQSSLSLSTFSSVTTPPLVQSLVVASPSSSKKKFKVVEENGESAGKFCSICMDNKPSNDFFTASNCSHFFCTDCISQYVANKIQENISMVKCPNTNCEGMIGASDCKDIVPKQVLERWEMALVESMMLVSGTTLYCPFKDCSALLLNDEEVVGSSECPSCHRLFCTQCKVGWHGGLDCAEFKRLGKEGTTREDVLAEKLAKEKRWRRCPQCMFFVEKTIGCVHITCRCTCEFCYECGIKWDHTHLHEA